MTADTSATAVATLAHGGVASEVETFIRSLGYNDQLHLLVWLCQADPELSARGVGALIQYHADAAEHRREKHRGRRRRQRAATVA